MEDFMKKFNFIRCSICIICIAAMFITNGVDAYAVSGPCTTDNGFSEFDIVYAGLYPQSEVIGSALTDEIVNANYNEEGIATVNDNKIARIERLNTASGTYGYYLFEPIEWRVLQVMGGIVTLQATKGLDCQIYSLESGIAFNDSELCKWLNSSFSSIAFQGNAGDGLCNISDSNEDKVTILSSAEACNSTYGLSTTSARSLYLTEFAEAQGALAGHITGGKKAAYWTKTANTNGKVDCINYLGNIYQKEVQSENVSVVPVIKM